MTTPERTVEVIRLYVPIVLGIFFIIYGLIKPNVGWVAAGASALGFPYLTSSKQ